MNITSTIAIISNLDHSMIPSEVSGKRKASDDNSLNSNGVSKSKRTRKDVSRPTMSVSLFVECYGVECCSQQAETYAFSHIFYPDLAIANTLLVVASPQW